MMCKCGHGKSMHNKGCAAGDINVGCACSSFEPAAESEWLDAARIIENGWYWVDPFQEGHSRPQTVRIEWLGPGSYRDKAQHKMRFQRVKPYSLPPAPLPRERQVKLSARIINDGRRGMELQVYLDGKQAHWVDHLSLSEAVEKCRDTYGIEPFVEGEE